MAAAGGGVKALLIAPVLSEEHKIVMKRELADLIPLADLLPYGFHVYLILLRNGM